MMVTLLRNTPVTDDHLDTMKYLLKDGKYAIEGFSCGIFKNRKNGNYIVSKEYDDGTIEETEYITSEFDKAIKKFLRLYENERISRTDEEVEQHEKNVIRLTSRRNS